MKGFSRVFSAAAAFAVVASLSSLVAAAKSSLSGYGSVVIDANGQLAFVEGKYLPDAIALANYTDWVDQPSAFGELSIRTSSNFNDSIQMRAAGFAEGFLTHTRVWDAHDNFLNWTLGAIGGGVTRLPSDFVQFFEEQYDWTRQNVASNGSELWQTIGLVLEQIEGLSEGYTVAAPAGGKNLTLMDLYIINNSIGDLIGLLGKFGKSKKDFSTMSVRLWWRRVG